MSTIKILEAYEHFFKEKVTPTIKLQKPSDDNVEDYELVNPQVHVGWVPPKGYLPAGMESAMPCLIVGMDDASDDGQSAEVNIRISVAVYSPGIHAPNSDESLNYTPDFKGYNDLLNLIDRTVDELLRNRIIYGVSTAELPIKWGMYQDQPYPYWYGYITFTASKNSSQFTKGIKELL